MYLLFDIGATKTRIALSKDGQNFETPVVFATPATYDEGMALFKKHSVEILAGTQIFGVAGGIAGAFSQKKATVVGAGNLKDWIGKPMRSDFEKFFNAPVYIENDTSMVGLGEAIYGAGRGFEIVVYITVSSGVGGCRIVKEKIDAKEIGFEPGNQIIDFDMTIIPNSPTLEQLISGKSIEARMAKPPKEITDPAFWDQIAKYLAVGLNNTIVHWSPSVVVLGGSMITGEPAIPLDKTEQYLKDFLKVYPELPVIRKAELQDFGGLWGALSYFKHMIV